jgi:hypothetical protein
MDPFLVDEIDQYEIKNRNMESYAYQQGFSDAMNECPAQNVEIYIYMLFFIVAFAGSHIIRSQRGINYHFI